ncbi:MAG TPA: polymer-forming cytoskeletal protein [Candidatus Limnocylindrales bacterium]|nr:polymer-forming cytoskeletal protein [Candidatus Limnocylindrales bacterium]
MFQERSARKTVTPITTETVLSNQIKLEGKLTSTSNIKFDGEMLGDLTTDGDVVVGDNGRVRGNVTGRNVVVSGTIDGNITTSGRLEILATGKVFGNIVVGSLIIDEGGILRGKSAVQGGEPAPSSVTVRGLEAAPAAA